MRGSIALEDPAVRVVGQPLGLEAGVRRGEAQVDVQLDGPATQRRRHVAGEVEPAGGPRRAPGRGRPRTARTGGRTTSANGSGSPSRCCTSTETGCAVDVRRGPDPAQGALDPQDRVVEVAVHAATLARQPAVASSSGARPSPNSRRVRRTRRSGRPRSGRG